jgi:prepilin-type N-terminal cleavage/methylation domain-containing protein
MLLMTKQERTAIKKTEKNYPTGFTIVELLIVIVVIGILAALVITTFTGIQQRARNTERQTDIKAIHGQVEAYYAQHGRYPTLANLNDTGFRNQNMRGLDAEALRDPKGSSTTIASVQAANVYSYAVLAEDDSVCDNVSADCAKYTLSATLEGGGTYQKSNLN